MDEIFVPNYTTFHNENTFYGSCRNLRFKLTPVSDTEEIRAEYWYGPLCYDMSQILGEKMFPMSEEGISVLTEWLTELAQTAPES